jgi:hypothetical protein
LQNYLEHFCATLKGIDAIFGELLTRYKAEATAETLKIFHESKHDYESRMRAKFDGNEHNFSGGELRDLHQKSKKISIDKFKNKAPSDLWSSNVAKLDQVCFFSFLLV